MTLHHLVGKDLGGDDKPDNLVPLCGTGTTGCHGAVQDLSPVACGLLRESLTLKELRYIVTKKSPAFLDRYYPNLSPAKETEQSAA